MPELAPDDENSLGPDLDEAAPEQYPPGQLGELMRQRDTLALASSNARTMSASYLRLADENDARIADLERQIAALDPSTETVTPGQLAEAVESTREAEAT